MKWSRILVPLLALVSSGVCLAQDSRSAPDPTQRAVTQAMHDGRFTDAEKLLTDAIHELEQNDPQNPRLATYLKRMAALVSHRGSREDANALIERAYEIDRNAYGPMDMRIALDLTQRAEFARTAGDSGKTEQLLNQALGIMRSNSEKLNSQPNTGIAAEVIGGLATLYIDEHRWVEAEPLLQEESKLCGLIEEPYRTGFAICGRLAEAFVEVYSAEGRTPDTAQLPYEGNSPRELESLNKIAKQFEADGLYPSAEDTYNRAIALAEKMEADPQNRYEGLIVGEMNSLGQVFEKEGFKDRAERTYLSALEIDEKKAGPELGHTAYAVVLAPQYLVNLYRSEGRLKDADVLLQHVLEIKVKSLGERNRAVVQTLTMLAGVYEEEGKSEEAKFAKALPLYERALAIQEANLGPNDRELLPLLGEYADLLVKLHDDARVIEVHARMDMISATQQNDQK
jgi:tetratricopeptide (TPR) repeat protein